MILLGMTISLIMLIIGSNIARAFALVGALSIIRFRNPVKDPRDVAFLFGSMAIGMACGTKFYLFATIFTLFFIFMVGVMHVLDFGGLRQVVHVLKVRMNNATRDHVERLCQEMCRNYSVISIDRMAGEGDIQDVIYELTLKRKATYADFVKRLTDISPHISVNLLVGDGSVNA